MFDDANALINPCAYCWSDDKVAVARYILNLTKKVIDVKRGFQILTDRIEKLKKKERKTI
jgi:hypothetical protein